MYYLVINYLIDMTKTWQPTVSYDPYICIFPAYGPPPTFHWKKVVSNRVAGRIYIGRLSGIQWKEINALG